MPDDAVAQQASLTGDEADAALKASGCFEHLFEPEQTRAAVEAGQAQLRAIAEAAAREPLERQQARVRRGIRTRALYLGTTTRKDVRLHSRRQARVSRRPVGGRRLRRGCSTSRARSPGSRSESEPHPHVGRRA